MALVLIVDDEPDLRFLLRKLLEQDEHEVAEAPNGEAALRRIEAGEVDVVIVDTTMPVMDGRRFIEELRRRDRNGRIPVIVWSDTPTVDIEADEVFAKPYGGPSITEAVVRLAQRS